MKLISLYIENFGGLSKYSLTFEAGLTVIEAENGFGKTTLAEFIRAMFYGFPRKGKTLDKSRRQKYAPWNGGTFGGNLVFETDGDTYRLERSFGATPKADTFTLIDLNTNKKSTRYTEEIGLELFGLDGDAFERSTYLPQLAEVGNLTTDSIRSKLSNLVEDTNDVGNYEKAVVALKTARSAFVPYRGNGGSVMQASGRISQLQEQLRQSDVWLQDLERCNGSIDRLQQQTQELREACDDCRERFRLASEAAAIRTVHSQEQAMKEELDADREALRRLQDQYPGGIPDQEKTESARQQAARLDLLKEKQVTEEEDLEAAAFLEANKGRFEGRIPTREELDSCRDRCEAYISLSAEARSKSLTEAEKEQYDRLSRMAETGLLEKQRLENLTKIHDEWKEKGHRRAALALPEEERRKLEALEAYFAPGVPDERTLREKQEELEQLRQLRQELNRFAADIALRPLEKTSPVPMILLLILGIGAVAAGIVLLTRQVFLWGGIALGAGILGLIGGAFAGIRMMLNRERNRAILTEQQALKAREDQIRELKESLSSFTVQYSSHDMPGTALYEIRDNREDYRQLQEKHLMLLQKQQELDALRAVMEDKLRRELGEEAFAEAIIRLNVAREQYLDLQQEARQAEEEAAVLTARAGEIQEQIREFLGRYGKPDPEDLHGALSELERSSDAYVRAEARVRKWQEEKQLHERELEERTEELRAFFAEFGLEPSGDVSAQLLRIRDDRRAWEDGNRKIRQEEETLAAFRKEKERSLAQTPPETPEDPEKLREAEIRLNLQLKERTSELLQLQQDQRQLKAMAEQIPQLRDDLQMWQEKKATDQHSADLLDDTMAFLEQAKENLSGSYLGPIRRSFGDYLSRLWEDQDGQTLVTQDLEVQLERCGQTRELGYFSAGQADLVMLCMRFALVDALFEDRVPCVILDDPFVNLDDRRADQALNLLEELAQDRQILYLTCSSSRTPK